MERAGWRVAAVVMTAAVLGVGCAPENLEGWGEPKRYGGPGTPGYQPPQAAPAQVVYQQQPQTVYHAPPQTAYRPPPQQQYQPAAQQPHQGAAFSDPPAPVRTGSGAATPAAPPGHYVAVSWSKPNGYMPAAQERSCRPGYTPANYSGKTLCVVCPSGASLHYLNNDYFCAACPAGHRYYVYGNNAYCVA